MSITTCRECGNQVSSEAEKCPSCGIQNPARLKNVLSIIGNIIGAVVGVFILFAVAGYFLESSSSASCELVASSIEADAFFVNGEPDAGYRYNARVKNDGEDGEITILVELSTSEGGFEREQTLHFDGQQTQSLSYTFHEPTIYATNVQGRISCSP